MEVEEVAAVVAVDPVASTWIQTLVLPLFPFPSLVETWGDQIPWDPTQKIVVELHPCSDSMEFFSLSQYTPSSQPVGIPLDNLMIRRSQEDNSKGAYFQIADSGESPFD